MRDSNERGIAMITALLMIMLMSALLIGFTAVIMSDQRYRFIDKDRGQAYYGASAGVEKLTSNLGNLFFSQLAPTSAQVLALTATPPVLLDPTTGLPVVTYTAAAAPGPLPASILSSFYCGPSPPAPKTTSTVTVGTLGYTITFCTDATGNPVATSTLPVEVGPYAGLIALQTPYQLDVTARTPTGGETHLVRTMNAVAIPVFQFGTFSDVDLSFFSGDDFNFGGRVHTNGNLFLAENSGNTLYLTGKVTAVGEVIRQQMQNGVSINTAPAHAGTVDMALSVAGAAGNPPCAAGCRVLAATDGSLVGGVGPPLSAQNPGWTALSLSTYNSFIRNGLTGATTLKLPLITVGGTSPDLIRRPCQTGAATFFIAGPPPDPPNFDQYPLQCLAVAENVGTPVLYNERLFTKASLRVLLSDTAADITNLPGVTATAPVLLDGNWNTAPPAGIPAYPAISSTNPPIALSPGVLSTTSSSSSGFSFPYTINFSSTALAAVFKPTFKLGVSANIITCTGQTTSSPWQLTGCSNVPTSVLANLTSISAAGGTGGIVSPISLATVLGQTFIQFSSSANLNVFDVMPFWDTSQVPPLLVTCTAYTATSYTGCSSKPANNAVLTSAAMSDAGTGLIGGYIKIERQNADTTWTDVTSEILNYGIGDSNQPGDGFVCGDPTPSAIIRLQKLRDNANAAVPCSYNTTATGAIDPTNWWPNVLYDTREALLRDINYPGGTTLLLGGVMSYVGLDVGNLAKWFNHGTAPFNVAGSTGNLAIVNGTGYTVYFSDRRNNRNANNQETAEYGWEDFLNPQVANGVPNGTLETGEDLNNNGVVDVYGGVPNYNGVHHSVPPCAACAATYGAAATTGYVLNAAANPQTTLTGMVAQTNRPILFRRTLMLENGSSFGNDIAANSLTGLTIVSENPVYIEGDYNANFPVNVGFGGAKDAAASVIADSVTLLSNGWADSTSFASPYSPGGRVGAAQPLSASPPAPNIGTWYRLAIVGGKGMAFLQPSVGNGIPTDFGTDGGAHNFLRFLENNSNITVNYLGATATFFYSRQSVGTYKCCTTVYSPPATRNYNFDINFLNPALLPPNTPVFRDINAVGFSQELRPGK